MTYLLGTLILLGVLITVHELGHYWVAKWIGVEVLTFSLGFGPKLFKRHIGKTEFVISAIPLGGYVRLYGSEFDEKILKADEKRAYLTQPPLKKIAIALGGPVANVIFTIFAFTLLAYIGQFKLSSQLGTIFEGTYAHNIGFRTHDKINSINEVPVKEGSTVITTVQSNLNKPTSFEVERVMHDNSKAFLTVTTSPIARFGVTAHGEVVQQGAIPGLNLMKHLPMLTLIDQGKWSHKVGLKDEDQILKINKTAISSLDAVWPQLKKMQGQKVTLEVKRKGTKAITISGVLPRKAEGLHDLGLAPLELKVHQIAPRSAAETADLQKGDVILSVNGETQTYFHQFQKSVQEVGRSGSPMALLVDRKGKPLKLSLSPKKVNADEDPKPWVRKNFPYVIGMVPTIHAQGNQMLLRAPGIIASVQQGLVQTWTWSVRFVVGIGKLVTGQLSAKSLAGPIYIGKMAGDWLRAGLRQFLFLMGLISLNLGLVNLVPIPILDGGQILMFTIEGIIGRRLKPKVVERAFQIGFAMIILLTLFVIYNDLARILK